MPGRQQVKHKRSIADLNGMPGVVSALIARHDVEALGEQIDDLAFAFIAPLGADYDDIKTNQAFLLSDIYRSFTLL